LIDNILLLQKEKAYTEEGVTEALMGIGNLNGMKL
jgi:hypothetical protein